MRNLLKRLEEAANPKNTLLDRMTRKGGDVSDLEVIRDADLSDSEKKFIARLPHFSQQDVWGRADKSYAFALSKKFKREDLPSWFIIDLPGSFYHSYLIDTEGYNYARYAAKLEK